MADQSFPENAPEAPAVSAIPLPLAPVADAERVPSLDVLRGFAVLGILAINIQQMGLPQAALLNPHLQGEAGLLHTIAWGGVIVLFLQKFMTIFSLLFGAGLVVMTQRAQAAGGDAASLHYRRMGWLLVIGLLHAYLLWWGDILFSYALCGMLVYLLRRLSPRRLLIIGALVFLAPAPFAAGFSGLIGHLQSKGEAASLKLEAGETLSSDERASLDAWTNVAVALSPAPDQISKEVDAHLGSYGGLFAQRALTALLFQTLILVLFAGWRICGLMLIGMALMKWRVFAAERSKAFYLRLALFGLGIGLPLDLFGASLLVSRDFGAAVQMLVSGTVNYTASAGSALGYIGIVMLLCRSGAARRLRTGLEAVGRTALSNYLLHTVVFTTVFYGYGLGLFGKLGLIPLLALMTLMWLVQLSVSPRWLRHFRFGPIEWLWRSLAYRKRQPFRRVPIVTARAAG
ncbi:MAG TPA: DUF418 domain-containing protein [candidate division Zixibacteria bacterium]|mgnify:FL=1|nr:DUF418 domain-containing protein [candidate division Zixibacteria bacterium]MDD4917690.1 DUF418 domain-containing protein [candidate division Zixibacteria bacterium]MDM7973595.1 DUF418 domain-containing protein [candidate division Zixibacteria bacterium]HOD65581.1 DUF418 domain-containing protein [candidate division Zixibacteria bacterium]HOZ07119.1 DUF418 domain-containing protein [candidate division Zixibacteria bacterium]